MGMFDSFYVQHQGQEAEVQSKQFARVLAHYHLGAFVQFDYGTPTGVCAFVEKFCLDYRDPAARGWWCVFLMLNGCFVDYLICDNEDEANSAAAVMVRLWQQPERQIEGLLRFAAQHYAARESNKALLHRVIALLDRYQSWLTCSGVRPVRGSSLHWHDFDETPWDIALASIFTGLDEYRCLLPKKYASLISDNADDAAELASADKLPSTFTEKGL